MKILTTIICFASIATSSFASEIELNKRIELLESKIEILTNMLEKKSEIVPIAEVKPIEPNKDVIITMKPSPKFETRDGNYKFALTGYLQTDYAHFAKNKMVERDGAYIRNARLGANGVINKDWFYSLENNFTGNKAKLTTALISYNGFKPLSLSFGQFNEKFGFENTASTKTLTFLEPAFLSVLGPSRRIGVAATTYGSSIYDTNWTANIGVNSTSRAYNKENSDAFKTISSRITFDPYNHEKTVIHFGASTIVGKPKTDKAVYRISAKPDLNIASELLDTGDIKNIKDFKLGGVEAMIMHNQFSAQAEYAENHLSRKDSYKNKHKAGYAQIAYTLTGESRIYDKNSANFGGISPTSPFGAASGIGAWEIAARYNYIDFGKKYMSNLNNRGMGNINLALNWYPNDYVRFMGNYIIVKVKGGRGTLKRNPNIILFRAQFGF